MAFYTFECKSCGKEFEVMCTMEEKEQKQVTCPECGANELDRIFAGFNVTVKGAVPSCPSAGACPHASGGCCRKNA